MEAVKNERHLAVNLERLFFQRNVGVNHDDCIKFSSAIDAM